MQWLSNLLKRESPGAKSSRKAMPGQAAEQASSSSVATLTAQPQSKKPAAKPEKKLKPLNPKPVKQQTFKFGFGKKKPKYELDFSTPESAILSLEAACGANDIDGALACKDFQTEAMAILRAKFPHLEQADKQVQTTAEILELSFRRQLESGTYLRFAGAESTFSNKEERDNNQVIVSEVCKFASGKTTERKILVQKTIDGWKVLFPVQ